MSDDGVEYTQSMWDDAPQIPPLRHRVPLSATRVVSWDHPNSDPVGDMKRVADAWLNEYLTANEWRIFTTIPMRRPVWPRIVLFPWLERRRQQWAAWRQEWRWFREGDIGLRRLVSGRCQKRGNRTEVR